MCEMCERKKKDGYTKGLQRIYDSKPDLLTTGLSHAAGSVPMRGGDFPIGRRAVKRSHISTGAEVPPGS